MLSNRHEIYSDHTYVKSSSTIKTTTKPLGEISNSKLNIMQSNLKLNGSFDDRIYSFQNDLTKLNLTSTSTFDDDIFDYSQNLDTLTKKTSYEEITNSEDEFSTQDVEFDDYCGDDMTDDDEDFFDNNGFFYPPWNHNIKNTLESTFLKFSDRLPDMEYEEFWDPVMVSEYSIELFDILRENEYKYSVNPELIQQIQKDFTWDDRKYLIQLIIKLHYRFRLTLETLYLTVNIVDRFLSAEQVSPNKVELIGAAALFIAAKYEEVHPPNMEQLLYCCGNEFDGNSIIEAERYMITTLNFELNYAGPLSFLRRISKADFYDLQVRTFAKYFLELTLMDHRFIGSPMSWLAAGATYISRKFLHPNAPWTDEHILYGGYTEEQLKPLLEVIRECCINYEQHHKVLYWKYSDKKYQKCSLYVQKFIAEGSAFQ